MCGLRREIQTCQQTVHEHFLAPVLGLDSVKVHDDVAAVQVLTDPIHQGEGRLAGLVGVVDPTQQVLGGRRLYHGRVRQSSPPETGLGLGRVDECGTAAVQGL